MANPDLRSIIAHLDSVLTQYNRPGFDTDEAEDVRALTTRCIAVIERVAPVGSAYTRMADALAEEQEQEPANVWYLEQLIGVVRALREDYVGGFMRQVEELVHAGVFDDFLEMAGELLSKGYKDPAAVIGGSVLEEHLRKLAARANVPILSNDKPVKADQLNAELVKKEVYNVLEQKGVTTWLDLRNKAAHGHYGDYDLAHVDLMLQGVRNFVARYPA